MLLSWLFRLMVCVTSLLLNSTVLADMAALESIINNNFGSPEALQNNFQVPMVNGGVLKSLDGLTTFNHAAKCQNSSAFLEVLALPSPTGDIAQLNIRQDKNWDGSFDSLTTSNTLISGVCANGIISCEAGTWNNCNSFQWVMDANGSPTLTQVPLSNLGGCYCINQSCGQALMLMNAPEVLSHIGGALVSAIGANNPTLIVSESFVDNVSMTFLGGLSEKCEIVDKNKNTVDQADFFSDPARLANAGSSTAQLNNLFKTITTGVASTDATTTSNNCTTNRIVTMDATTLNDIILYDGGAGGLLSCGDGCLQIVLGKIGDNYWDGGTCKLFKHDVQFWVERPERIISATLINAKFDDHIQISANDQYIWAHESAWTDLSDASYPPSTNWNFGTPICERSVSWDVSPNIDFTNLIKQFGQHKFAIRVAVSGNGEGYAYAQVLVDESCQLNADVFEDSCAAFAKDPDCDLSWESVDGITTVNNYNPTGLTPLATTKDITGNNCVLSATRDWWSRERNYKCKKQSQFDFTDGLNRTQIVTDSANASGYDDYRLEEESGQWVSDQGSLAFPNFTQQGTCEHTCKAQKKIEHDAVAGMGPQSNSLTNADSIEYKYYTCTSDGACPLEPGETVVTNCGCHSYLLEAALQMQSGRLAGQDTLCSSGTPSDL